MIPPMLSSDSQSENKKCIYVFIYTIMDILQMYISAKVEYKK